MYYKALLVKCKILTDYFYKAEIFRNNNSFILIKYTINKITESIHRLNSECADIIYINNRVSRKFQDTFVKN